MKNIYYGPDLRHKVKLSEGAIISVLQRRWFIFLWKYVPKSNIHFRLRKGQFQNELPPGLPKRPYINPSTTGFITMGFTFSGPVWGQIETWDEDTFDLKVRLYEIANEYIKSMQVQKTYASIAEKQIDEL